METRSTCGENQKNFDKADLENLDDQQWGTDETDTKKQMFQISQAFEDRVDQAHRRRVGRGILDCQRGRSRTMTPKVVPPHQVPLKPSRPGSFQPQYHQQNLAYQRWVTQLRRCESLTRLLARKEPWKANHWQHAFQEWRAICRSVCAQPNFATWWTHFPDKLGHPIENLSHAPPSPADMQSIAATVTQHVRHLEKVLMRDARKIAEHNRENDPHKIFRDFARPAVHPVRMLDLTVTGIVQAHDPDEHAIVIDEPQRPFAEGALQTSVGDMQIIQFCENKIWLDSSTQLPPVGTHVQQEKLIGSINTMCEMFIDEWSKRWDRHKDTPPSTWTPLVDFFRAAYPEQPTMPLEKITIQMWKRTIKRKKKHAASGPDGWTRNELLSLPDDITMAIMSLFEQIEAGAPWPPQMVLGLVHSLEK